jgi:hypothetical protein
VSKKRLRLSDFIYQPKPVLPPPIKHTQTNRTQEKILHDESSQHPVHHTATHYRELKQAVERFAQPSEPDAQSTQATTTADNRRGGTKTSGIDVAKLVSTTVNAPRPTNREEDSTTQSANQQLLGRITKHQSTTVRNAQIRQTRISALTRQNPVSLDPLGFYTNGRRKRVRKITERFKQFDSDFTAQYIAEQQRISGLRRLNQRARLVKDGFNKQGQRIDKVTVGFNQFHGAIKAIIELIVNLLKRLFNSLSTQFNSVVKVNTETKQPLSAQQKTDYVNSRQQSVGWYSELKDEVKILPKERKNDNILRPR